MNSLEDRITAFSAEIILFSKSLPKDSFGVQVSDQLTRASLSVSLNWGESQNAESDKDYIHKISISLKELQEIKLCLLVVGKVQQIQFENNYQRMIREANQLLAILNACKNKAIFKIKSQNNIRS